MSTSPEQYREKYAEALAGPEGRSGGAAQPVNALSDSHYDCSPEALTLQDQLPVENLTRRELRELIRQIGAVRGREDVTAARLRDWAAAKDARIARLEEELEAQREQVLVARSGRRSLANLGSIAVGRARMLPGAAANLAGRGKKTLRRSGKGENE